MKKQKRASLKRSSPFRLIFFRASAGDRFVFDTKVSTKKEGKGGAPRKEKETASKEKVTEKTTEGTTKKNRLAMIGE